MQRPVSNLPSRELARVIEHLHDTTEVAVVSHVPTPAAPPLCRRGAFPVACSDLILLTHCERFVSENGIKYAPFFLCQRGGNFSQSFNQSSAL